LRLVCASSELREYVTDSRSLTFFKPHQAHVTGVGLVNDERVFLSTTTSVSELHRGLTTPVVEVPDGRIVAFHVCQHRSSIIYEVLALEGGILTLSEYSWVARRSVHVREFKDTMPATSLACLDDMVLRASASSLTAVSLQGGQVNVLYDYEGTEDPDVITSVSIGYAADVFTRALIYGIAPRGCKLFRLHLTDTLGQLHVRRQVVLEKGEGRDGQISTASAHALQHILWTRDRVLFTDGCALRVMYGSYVRTLLGIPTSCVSHRNETLEPVPWASRLSRLQGLAAPADATLAVSVLVLTDAEVVQIVQTRSTCREIVDETACTLQQGCAWSEGAENGQALCFDCDSLVKWANAQKPRLDHCRLQEKPRRGTRYRLTGCGC